MSVHTEIPVGDNIPDTGKTAPVYFRVICSKGFREIFRCFTNYLKVAEDSILCPFVGHQLIKGNSP